MAATVAPAPAVRTFQPTQRIVGRELHGDRAAVELECGHVADVPVGEAFITLRCQICKPVEVLRWDALPARATAGQEVPAHA